MSLIEDWMARLQETLAGDDANPLAERCSRWLARGDSVVLGYLMVQELRAVRAAVEALAAKLDMKE
jgi:hypothetical protein